MSVLRYIQQKVDEGSPTGVVSYYVCTTIAELPSSGIQVGDIATTIEGPKIYLGFDATTWRELTKAGSSGYAGTEMLGSGTANSTTYLRGDNTWATPPGGGGPPEAHAASHQNGGTDEISVAGLSGVLADAQTPAAHTHAAGDLPDLDGITAPNASVNFNGQQATSFRIENRTSDPGTPATGEIWLRTDL